MHIELLSIKDIQSALKLGRTKVCELIADGDIESMKIGRRRLSTPDAIDRFIARMAAGELTASELRKNASRQLISVAGQESRLCNRNTLEHRIKRS